MKSIGNVHCTDKSFPKLVYAVIKHCSYSVSLAAIVALLVLFRWKMPGAAGQLLILPLLQSNQVSVTCFIISPTI